MQFCTEHWQALRDAVEARGMSHLVARSGEEAVEDAVAQLEGRGSLDNWDPLMAAHWAISGRVLRAVGLAAMAPGFCPLCAVQEDYEAVRHKEIFRPELHHSADWWINSCMDSMLAYAREQGLMPGVQ